MHLDNRPKLIYEDVIPLNPIKPLCNYGNCYCGYCNQRPVNPPTYNNTMVRQPYAHVHQSINSNPIGNTGSKWYFNHYTPQRQQRVYPASKRCSPYDSFLKEEVRPMSYCYYQPKAHAKKSTIQKPTFQRFEYIEHTRDLRKAQCRKPDVIIKSPIIFPRKRYILNKFKSSSQSESSSSHKHTIRRSSETKAKYNKKSSASYDSTSTSTSTNSY